MVDPTGMAAESTGPPVTPIGAYIGIKIANSIEKAVTKYNLLGAGGFVFFNSSGGANGKAPLARESKREYQPDYIDAAPILQIAEMFGPGSAKVSRKAGGGTKVQDIFKNFAAGVEAGKKVESGMNAVKKHDEANERIITGVGVIINFNIHLSDGETTSIEEKRENVPFKGTSSEVKKSQDSLQAKNNQRERVKQLYEKVN